MRIILATILSLASLTCHAEGSFTISGLGTNSCGAYVMAINARNIDQGMTYQGETYYPKSAAYVQWVSGFVSASNRGKKEEKQDMTDIEGLTLWIKNYCESHPDLPLAKAAIDFMDRKK